MKLVTVGNTVFLDGKQLPPVPHSERGVSVATDNKNVYENGYILKNGKWKWSLIAAFRCL